MEFESAIMMPLIIAAILAAWRQMSVLPFSLAIFGITQDYSLLFDPIDFVFAMFKIELTDGWTLLFMVILMCIGVPVQLQSVK